MSEPDHEARLSALEAQIGELASQAQAARDDAAAARHLAAANDRDVAEIRTELRDFRQATTGSFNALREDLADLRSQTNAGFTEMRGKLDHAAAGQERIMALLTTLLDQNENDEQ